MGQHNRCAGGKGGGLLLTTAPAASLDLSGAEDFCADPTPLERVRRAYSELSPGQQLEVRTNVAEHAFAVRAWSRKSGVRTVSDTRDGGVTRLVVERGRESTPLPG